MGALMHVKFVAFLVHQYYWSVLGKNEKRNDELILFNFNERVKHVSLAMCWLWFVKWLGKKGGTCLVTQQSTVLEHIKSLSISMNPWSQILIYTVGCKQYWKWLKNGFSLEFFDFSLESEFIEKSKLSSNKKHFIWIEFQRKKITHENVFVVTGQKPV